MDKLQLQNGLDEVFKVIDRANKYIDETAPWALGKEMCIRDSHQGGHRGADPAVLQDEREAVPAAGASGSVSYTHLDVYKRQLLW